MPKKPVKLVKNPILGLMCRVFGKNVGGIGTGTDGKMKVVHAYRWRNWLWIGRVSK